jgi:NADH dehydrogenase
MKIAITGGTGFVGRHFARALIEERHEVVLIARRHRHDLGLGKGSGVTIVTASVDDVEALERAFAGCAIVAHCAGINREIGDQTYERVHVQGTTAVIDAARRARVQKVILLSFLRARPGSERPYHDSKWRAEEIVRTSGLDYTILKAGVIYGQGDHLLDHLSHALHTFPYFGLVGRNEGSVAPVAVEDVVEILRAATLRGELSRSTISVVGPERMSFGEVVRRVGEASGRRPRFVRLPVALHLLLARIWEVLMRVPLVSLAQVRILAEGADLLEGTPDPPAALAPKRALTAAQIRQGLPPPGPFRFSDLRCCPAGSAAAEGGAA